MFSQENFNKFLIENNVVGFFEEPITLKSKRISNWYINCRNLLDRVGSIDTLIDFIIDFINEKNLSFDYVFGVPEGVTKLADILNYKIAKQKNNNNYPLVMGRGKPKDHGALKDKFYIGPVKQGDNVIVIEDVTTTGSSLIKWAENLQQTGVNIVAAIGLSNRMEKRDDNLSVKEKLKQMDITYYEMSNAFELIPLAIEKYKPDIKILDELKKYFQQYGIKELSI